MKDENKVTISDSNGKELASFGSPEEFAAHSEAAIQRLKNKKTDKKEERYLRYDFKATEIVDLSMNLANKTQELTGLEDEKTSIASQYKSKIDGVKAELGSLANKVSSGYEMRRVECLVRFHYPEQGKKTVTRTDTNEETIEPMSQDEWNLFNQEAA